MDKSFSNTLKESLNNEHLKKEYCVDARKEIKLCSQNTILTELKLDEADQSAENSDVRLTHSKVFENVKQVL